MNRHRFHLARRVESWLGVSRLAFFVALMLLVATIAAIFFTDRAVGHLAQQEQRVNNVLFGTQDEQQQKILANSLNLQDLKAQATAMARELQVLQAEIAAISARRAGAAAGRAGQISPPHSVVPSPSFTPFPTHTPRPTPVPTPTILPSPRPTIVPTLCIPTIGCI